MKNKNKKLIFFDIDGTLVDFKGKMPSSTYNALKQAQKNGHEIFLNTGRSKNNIYEFLLKFPFDGIVSSTGCYVEYKNKAIKHNTFTKNQTITTMKALDAYKSIYLLETFDALITTEEFLNKFKTVYLTETSNNSSKTVLDTVPALIIDNDINNYPNKYTNVESFCYAFSTCPIKQLNKKIKPYGIGATKASFKKPDDFSGEITLENCSKISGIETIVKTAGLSPKSVISIGDGPNDIDMLESSALSIAMGNSVKEAKQAADYITTDIDNDGISNALKHFDVI